MLSLQKLRKNYDDIAKKIRTRNRPYLQLESFLEIDKEWLKITNEMQELSTQKNLLSSKISSLINKDVNNEIATIKEQVLVIKSKMEELTKTKENLDKEMHEVLFSIPNIPDSSVPIGKDENDNIEIRKFLEPTKFNFDAKPHWELGENLKIIDFVRAAKISGTRHTIFKGDGALLLRALRNFTLDQHVSNGFMEFQTPVILNAEPLYGTGNLPKYEEDLFKLNNNQFLSPTEEIPLTSYYMNEIVDKNLLPIKLTCSNSNFRSEAGSAGRDVRGVIRQHQFYNTEMVILDKPENSMQTLEWMTNCAENILKLLNIPYRVILLCTGDMGASAVKTYDIEVWMPSSNSYREISSCSNTEDYQARGLGIKYAVDKQSEFVHTLNGTGTSLNRLWAAIIENFQQADGTIKIPEILVKYMNNKEYIK